MWSVWEEFSWRKSHSTHLRLKIEKTHWISNRLLLYFHNYVYFLFLLSFHGKYVEDELRSSRRCCSCWLSSTEITLVTEISVCNACSSVFFLKYCKALANNELRAIPKESWLLLSTLYSITSDRYRYCFQVKFSVGFFVRDYLKVVVPSQW